MQQNPGSPVIAAGIQPACLSPGQVLEQPQYSSFACLGVVHIQIIVAYGSGIQHSRYARMKSDTTEPLLRQRSPLPGLPFIPADP
ncbi:hypothetical protein D3C75_1081540 [compost metagenome]